MLVRLIIVYIFIINIIAFILYGIDKKRAIKDQWRISEFNLIVIALVGGSLGALFGMIVFHHKTRHWKFRILVPLCLIVHIYLLCIFFNSGL